ncbi:hypothetical protein HAP41_0000005090 [Bradyrhizobium barranii subsp. apii]|uniref:Uncharacterized protein n=1 Tax=Bradyrhizobium barranii subsp. apii TaxID=2819348 RepID=A0A8T5VJ24_9BRAD|nr:hypothetical protein [Bradyrhizobium barranii]UPT88475.1 hypothetical protein HAP41_0000005090 [Bradyrhizobium barranii subsp. apii]
MDVNSAATEQAWRLAAHGGSQGNESDGLAFQARCEIDLDADLCKEPMRLRRPIKLSGSGRRARLLDCCAVPWVVADGSIHLSLHRDWLGNVSHHSETGAGKHLSIVHSAEIIQDEGSRMIQIVGNAPDEVVENCGDFANAVAV